MALAIMLIMFVGSQNVVRADGCDAYNGPISIHPDPDRFYPNNPAYTESNDRDYNNADTALDDQRGDRSYRDSDHSYTRVDYREDHAYGSQEQFSSDDRLTHRIRHALYRDHSLSPEAKNISVYVQNGVVTLRGAVDSRSERHRVVAKAESIAGSDNVNNRLSVLPQ